jgi:hypothetical protein
MHTTQVPLVVVRAALFHTPRTLLLTHTFDDSDGLAQLGKLSIGGGLK